MKTVKIVMCGVGRVGSEFIRILADRSHALQEDYCLRPVLSAVADIGGAAITRSDNGLDAAQLLDHLGQGGSVQDFGSYGQPGLTGEQAIDQAQAQVLVEATPTNLEHGQPGKGHILSAISRGMQVVSANKGPFVLFYQDLHDMARRNNCGLYISAAAAAALPTLDVGRICLAGAEVQSVQGILNGTTNYILTQMRDKGTDFEQALKQAQEMGIAETDPSYDLQGQDTANKMILICNRILGTAFGLGDISIQGITSISAGDIAKATEQGWVLKLVGSAVKRSGRIELAVAPKLLDEGHPLASVNGSEKAISYQTDTMGEITLSGGRSSPVGAAAALLKDLINAYR